MSSALASIGPLGARHRLEFHPLDLIPQPPDSDFDWHVTVLLPLVAGDRFCLSALLSMESLTVSYSNKSGTKINLLGHSICCKPHCLVESSGLDIPLEDPERGH